MSLRQIDEASNIITLTSAFRFLISEGGYKKDESKKIIDAFENDIISFNFKDDGDISFDPLIRAVIIPIKWHKKGHDTWNDIMRIATEIDQFCGESIVLS